MIEKPAKGVKGFLLYNPFTEKHFFRIYNPEDKRKFTDYDLCAEDIEIEILAGGLSLYETGLKNRLDWASRFLHKD